MGRIKHSRRDRKYVLAWFGDKELQAKKDYRQYVKEGISHGRRPELVGGGLIRSLGGWSQVAEVARQVGVSTSAISKTLNRTKKD